MFDLPVTLAGSKLFHLLTLSLLFLTLRSLPLFFKCICIKTPGQPTGNRKLQAADLESLTYAVVERGLTDADANEDNLHAKIVNRVERELIAQVMISVNNVQTKAAARLGINRNTLHKKLKEYNLES